MAKQYKGDMQVFRMAIPISTGIGDIINSMNKSHGINKSAFYRLEEKLIWDYWEKEAAAAALGKTIEEIFGTKGEPTDDHTNPPPPDKKRIPMIGEGAAGAAIVNTEDSHYISDYVDVGDLLSDSEAAFTVYGNSMTPAYPSGCVLGIKKNHDNFIQPGETYLLLSKSNRVFKRLYYNADRTGYLCISDNTMKHETGPMTGQYFYPPFEVKGEDVLSIFDVTGMIRRNRNSGIMQRQT